MESLFQEYPVKINGSDEFEAFKSFYSKDLSSVVIWLKTKFLKRKYAKSSSRSQKLRNVGNSLFFKKKYEEAAKKFTSALNYAEYNSKEYSLALANRSATFVYLEQYKACIKDVDECLKSNYPNNLQYKVYMRKAECLEKLGCSSEAFIELVRSVILNTDSLTDEEKENQIKKIKYFNLCNTSIGESIDSYIARPDYDFIENVNFAYASEAVKLCYDKTRGRHVRAARNITEGEILFLEEALFFAPVFMENETLVPDKCHNCLTDAIASVPCKSCTLFIYCNEKCREESWEDFHKWECVGMTASIWFDLGIAFPAFRAVVKGLKSQLVMPEEGHESMIEKFGDKEDNYLYFNRLLSNIERLESLTQILVLSSVVVKYLERETDFFSYAEKHLNAMTIDEIKVKCGGLLMRHMLQLSGNSSVIEHWNKPTDRIPTECSQIACAIYPSVSMMNHSCKANIAIYYNKTMVTVKALYDIKEDEEIFNCYGVDYRYTNYETRQSLLKSLYHFSCKCEICTNSLLEYDIFDSYLCQNCKGPLSNISGMCYSCKKPAFLEYYKRLESEANAYIEKDPLTISDVDTCYKIRCNIYTKNHIKICECFDLYSSIYKKQGNLMKVLEYFKKSLNLRKMAIGCNARSLTIESIYTIAEVIEELKKNPNGPDKMDILKEIGLLYTNSYKILLLYYTSDDLSLTDIHDFIKEHYIE